MSDVHERVAASFAAQGLMSTLGAQLVKAVPGEVQIAMRSRPQISQHHGYVHAGALTSIVDSACGYAALSVAPAGFEVLTVEFKINFMRPASADRFLAIGRVRKAGKTLSVCHGEVIGEQGSNSEVVALMQATIIIVSNAGNATDR